MNLQFLVKLNFVSCDQFAKFDNKTVTDYVLKFNAFE